ncbi:MAG TPA: DinB family protein [Bryobacteraceae bacterium]|nr:DinB family protein [Bryobacteraceae bacterium]
MSSEVSNRSARVPELDECRKQFQAIADEALQISSGLTEAQFNWRPAEDRWSIEECLAHLIIVGQRELKEIERAVDDAIEKGLTGSGPFSYGFLERTILNKTEPPLGHQYKSPRRFLPLHGQPLTAVIPTFRHLQRQLAQQAERANGLDLARVKVATPILRFMKFGLGFTFAQIAAHERRHLAQARHVREDPAFPA